MSNNLRVGYSHSLKASHINNPQVKERFESARASEEFHTLIVFSQIYWYCS